MNLLPLGIQSPCLPAEWWDFSNFFGGMGIPTKYEQALKSETFFLSRDFHSAGKLLGMVGGT